MDSLPEELQLHIFTYLDSQPPSERKARHEPSLNLTKSSQHGLKDLSYVSKRWRRIVLPLLFRHACLRLDVPSRQEWDQCSTCGRIPGKGSCERYHAEMAEVMVLHVAGRTLGPGASNISSHPVSPCDNVLYADYECSTAIWATRMYHALDDFIKFLRSRHLTPAIQSFVLMSDRMLSEKNGRFPHETGQSEWRYPASAAFWRHLLSYVSPKRITTVAPPMELACFMNASIDTFGDWAFTDMDFHILEFKIEDGSNHRNTLPGGFGYEDLQAIPAVHPGFAGSCLFSLLPWTHISLNEGSFLKAYGTYEFFERGPPSLVYSIGRTFTSRNNWRSWGDKNSPTHSFRSSLRSFTYTGIFPFSNHADFRMMIPYLEELDVQFAPDPQSGILDDRERTGKAELQDCWQELMSAYNDIATTIATFNMSALQFPKLKRFICRDVRIRALQEDLDEIFTPLCMPVWAEFTPGDFRRLAMSPSALVNDGVGF